MTPVGADGSPIGLIGEVMFENPPVPIRLVARTVTVYSVSVESPLIVQERRVDVQNAAPGEAVAVYEVMNDPPEETGANQLTVSVPLPALTAADRGGPGTLADAGETACQALAQALKSGENGDVAADATPAPNAQEVARVTRTARAVLARKGKRTMLNEQLTGRRVAPRRMGAKPFTG